MSKMAPEKYKSKDKSRFSIPKTLDTQDLSISFYFIIKALQLFGSCPLTIKPIRDPFNNNAIVKYKYSWRFFSLAMLHTTVGFASYSLYIWYIIIFQVFEGKFTSYADDIKGPYRPKDTDWSVSCFVFVYFIWLWLNPSLLVVRCNYVAQFLDGITTFRRQFESDFNGKRVNFSLAKASMRHLFMGNALILFILVAGLVESYFPCLSNFISSSFRFQCYNQGLFEAMTSLLGVIGGTICNLHQDTMLISLFRVIENMLLEVKIEMERHSSHCPVDTKTIQNWMKIGRVLKRQGDILKYIIGPNEIGSLLMNFLTWVLLAFMIVNMSTLTSAMVGPLAFFCFSNLVRLQIKTASVTRITAVEKQIRDLLIKMEMETYSPYAECERAFLVNVMACRPIRFTLCNMITLDARLTTWLIGGVVTYLMVLLQFQDLISSDKK